MHNSPEVGQPDGRYFGWEYQGWNKIITKKPFLSASANPIQAELMKEVCIAVDEHDKILGSATKAESHHVDSSRGCFVFFQNVHFQWFSTEHSVCLHLLLIKN